MESKVSARTPQPHDMQYNLRRLRFQTVLASGAAADFPLVVRVLVEPPRLELFFATSFNLEACSPGVPVGVTVAEEAADSGREAAFAAAAFCPRNVLLTETDLKLVGFLAADEARPFPLSSLGLVARPVDASVSEPPLTLTSAEIADPSRRSVTCLLATSSRGAGPFSEGAALPESPF